MDLIDKDQQGQAGQNHSLRREKYVLVTQDRSFFFETGGGEGRLKFLCAENDPRLECWIDEERPAPEIYLVTSTRGARGDIIYKSEGGQMRLRIASYGGATVYWPGDAEGSAASRSFDSATPLLLEPMTAIAVHHRLRAASDYLSQKIGTKIVFETDQRPERRGSDYSVLADAIMMAVKALSALAEDEAGSSILARRLQKVRFIKAEKPYSVFKAGALDIFYVPDLDVKGRQSSRALLVSLEKIL